MPTGAVRVPFPSNSPPQLPVPRQPSPLSFSSVGVDAPPSPLTPASSILRGAQSSVSSASSSRIQQDTSTPRAAPTLSTLSTSPSPPPPSAARADSLVPTQPLPDSLLLKSTLSALEHSAVTLKRLSKSVLTAASVVHAIAEQLEKAEDDLFVALGDLGRWLESGYGVQNKHHGVWDKESGIRKVHREKRKREREEMEVWVVHGLKAVKAELKRQGLAGDGAHARYENTAKQFYHQTSVYLSPQAASTSSNAGPSSHSQATFVSSTSSSNTGAGQSGPSDIAHALRHAQWDLARYNHHSTLLYAVPPSSVGCLDLLVGFYGWVGGLLGETPGRKDGTEEGGRRQAATTGEKLANSEMPIQLLSRPSQQSSSSEIGTIKTSLSSSLSQLAKTRSDLLHAWAERTNQTALLENEATRRQQDLEVAWTEEPDSPKPAYGGGNAMTPVCSAGVEHKKAKKHKIHRSVGGRLKEFLALSTSSHALATQGNVSGRSSRMSLDVGYTRGEYSEPAPIRRRTEDGSTTPNQPSLTSVTTQHPFSTAAGVETGQSTSTYTNSAPAGISTPPLPPPKQSSSSPRPSLPSRHSVQMPNGLDYISPFIASGKYPSPVPLVIASDIESSAERERPRHSIDVAGVGVGRPTIGLGGVGGLGAGGDEDERREEAGRKKEGVLWGLGSWEGLSKGSSGKGKWEKFWVVLDHSRIYEYRDNPTGMPEHAHAVIDLKFASVREGRGTDRRFVFEIVTPSQGRRLYQATSEQEMKLWLYAICNAIESCINGTSSVRTFDASKLRTVSGSLDDHALPTRTKLGLGFNGRVIGLGLPMPHGGRRSMPPTPTGVRPGEVEENRTRKTSLKKVLKQSGERLSNAVTGGGGSGHTGDRSHRNSFGASLDLPRPSFIKGGSSRSSLPLSTPETDTIPSSSGLSTPTTISTPPAQASGRPSWADGEIEKRVLEMAGLGLGLGPSALDGGGESPGSAKRRVKSEAVRKIDHQQEEDQRSPGGQGMTRSKSDDRHPAGVGQGEVVEGTFDITELKRIAELEGNRTCADCGKSMRASRWATTSLRKNAMVMFICIRCCGVHRSLGTHISKPRSVDLDIWSPEMVRSAQEWGNERGNTVWEWGRRGAEECRPSEDGITDFIRAKYVEGRWLSEEDRARFEIRPVSSMSVGKAI
ncbi:hypothetical protein IAR55_005340 [Kwoniella newhampshirensis]|uniref:Zinc finger protein n=1 Tax=Kwoniella newhampshirensis TaxID=1651941 RepID=A0AAW0YW14_9TREE